MSTNKYYKKYASGGRFQNRRIDDGTAAMRQQVEAEVAGIRRAGEQVTQQRNQQLKALDRKAQIEADNRRRVFEFEAEISKVQQAGEDRNHTTRLNNLKKEQKEYEKKAKMWADLSPTLMETFANLSKEVKTFVDTKSAVTKYQEDVAAGNIGKFETAFALIARRSNYVAIANARAKSADGYAKDDVAKQLNFDYITKSSLANNTVYQELIFDDIQRNYPGREAELLDTLKNQYNIKVDGSNVVALFQYHAAELMRQYNITPTSKLGIKMMRLFTSRSQTLQNRFTLEDRESNLKSLNEDLTKGLNVVDGQNPHRTDYPTDALYQTAKKAQYDQMNSYYIDINSNLTAMPIRNTNGLKVDKNPNINSNYDAYAITQMQSFTYFDNFMRVMYGLTEDNPYGYTIPNAPRDSTKKTDRILGKFPDKIAALAEIFEKEQKDLKQKQDALEDQDLKVKAKPIKEKIDTGYYKDKDDEFFADWEANNGNKYARDALGKLAGFKSDFINENTFNSTMVQAYKNGDFTGFYSAWAARPDSEQNIGAGDLDTGTLDISKRIKGLQELAIAEGVPLAKLDNRLRDYTKGKIDDVIKMTNRSQVAHSSAQGMPERALAWLLEKYNSYPDGIPAGDKLRSAKSELESMLGIDGVDVVDPNAGGYRGVGEFRQKVGKSGTTNSVIFLAEAGQMYGDVSALEVDMEMDRLSKGRRNESSLKEAQLNTLANFVYSKDGTQRITEAELDELAMSGETSNELINHLMSKEVLGDIPADDFINKLLETNPTYKELTPDQQILKKWGGNKWCTHMLGNTNPNVNNTRRAVLAACIQAIEAEFGTPDDIGKNARTILLNPKIRNELRRGGDELE